MWMPDDDLIEKTLLHNEKWNKRKKNRVDEIKLRIFFSLLYSMMENICFFGPFFGTRTGFFPFKIESIDQKPDCHQSTCLYRFHFKNLKRDDKLSNDDAV